LVVRYYSSVAPETTLTGSITSGSTSITVGSTTGFPALTPYTLALDYESASEELVQVNSAAGLTLTVTRAIDGTSATSHNAGARVRHVSSARDFADSRTHENSDEEVHGLGPGEEIVGTDKVQTLSNKTLNMATGTLNRVDIFNGGPGSWVTTVNGNAAFPSADLMAWRPTNVANAIATVSAGGLLALRNLAATDAANSTYKFRITKSNGTTDIFAVLSGGQTVSWLSNGMGSGFTLNAPPDDVVRPAFRVNAPDGSTQRAAINTDGSATLGGVAVTSLVSTGSVLGQNFKAGRAIVPAAPANTTTTFAIVFDFPMSAPPTVTITPDSANDMVTDQIRFATTSITSSGFTIRSFRQGSSNTAYSWQAIVPTQ